MTTRSRSSQQSWAFDPLTPGHPECGGWVDCCDAVTAPEGQAFVPSYAAAQRDASDRGLT